MDIYNLTAKWQAKVQKETAKKEHAREDSEMWMQRLTIFRKSTPFPHGQCREHRCDTLKDHSRLDHIENLMVGKSFIVAINHDDHRKLES